MSSVVNSSNRESSDILLSRDSAAAPVTQAGTGAPAASYLSTGPFTPPPPANANEGTGLSQSHSLIDSRTGNLVVAGGQFHQTHGHSVVVHINQSVNSTSEGSPASPAAESSSRSNPPSLNEIHHISPVQFSGQSSRVDHERSQVSSQSQEISKCNEIYERHLTLKGRGFPLWIPGPNRRLHLNYRRTGVRIGDVGTITDSGAFSFLFNICLPHDDPVNPRILPENFAPIFPPIEATDIEDFVEFENGSHLASASVKRSQAGISDIVFESSASEGAILTMPQGARSEDLGNLAAFREYETANVANWYRYVNGRRGREAKNGEVRLVTGFDKTTSWGIATFANQTQVTHQNSCRLKFGPSEGDSTSTYTWSEKTGVADWNVREGPGSNERDHLRIASDPPDVQFENQCLFVRTLNATLADDVWADIHYGSDSVPVDPRTSRYPRVKDYSYSNRPHSNNSGNTSNLSPSQGAQSGTQRRLQGVDIMSDGNPPIFVTGPVDSIKVHPSKVLNDILLRKIPTAKMVITHDDDWSSVTQYDTLLDPHEFVANILASRDICQENDVVFLQPKKIINEISEDSTSENRNTQVPEVAVMQHEGSLTNAIFRYPTSSSSFTPLSLSSEPKRKPKAGPNQFLQPNTNPSAFTNARDEEPESVEWGHGGMGSIKEWFINLKHKAFPWVFGRRTQDRDYDEFGTHTAHTPHVLYEPHSSFKPTPSPIDHEYLQPPRTICKKKALLVGVQRPLEGLHKDVQDMRQFLIDRCHYEPHDIILLINTDDPEAVQPTKKNIEKHCVELVAGAREGDCFFFLFAGHTMQKPTDGEEEEDGKDEYIVTSDDEMIQDNYLRMMLVDPLPAGAKLVAVFDARNSATSFGLDLEHYRCNRVFVPWVNKGFRRTQSQWNSVVRRGALPGPLRSPTMDTQEIVLPAMSSSQDNSRSMSSAIPMPSPTTLSAEVVAEVFPISRPSQRSTYIAKSSASDDSRWYNYPEDPMVFCDSPVSRFCTGNCRTNNSYLQQLHFTGNDKADVICLSSGKNPQRSWHSISQILIEFLKKSPNATIKDVLTAVSHELYAFDLDMHQRARQYKLDLNMHHARQYKLNARRRGKGKAPFKRRTVEMDNFQEPQISSHKPLDMNRLWNM